MEQSLAYAGLSYTPATIDFDPYTQYTVQLGNEPQLGLHTDDYNLDGQTLQVDGLVTSDGAAYPFSFTITYRAVMCSFNPLLDVGVQQTELFCALGSSAACELVFDGASNGECAYTIDLVDLQTN